MQNIAYHIAEESAIVVTLGRELNIVFPASANLPARFIDVPLGNILGVSFGQLETQSQTRTYGLVIQLSNQGGNTFIVNATGRSNTQVGLAFESEAVAVSLKKAIESKSVGEKDLITSRSEAVDFSALQSNDDPVGYGVRLTNAKDSTVNDSNAKALASKRSRIDTVTSATIDLKRASRRSATHLYETCANGNNNIPNVQIAHTSVAISPIDDSPTGVLRPANANTEKNLDEASPVELTNSVQRGESAVASSKAIRLFVPETPQASRSKNDRIVLQDSDEEYESHDDLYTATPKKAQEKPSGRNSVTHEGQPEMEEAQVKRNEKGQFKVKSSRTAITDSRPNYQLRKRLRKRDGQIVPRNSAAARNEVSDREECGLGERSENSIASTKPASISKKTRAGTKKLTEEMRTSRISKSKKKTQMNVKNHDTEEPELEHPCTHSKSRREPQTATRASAARLSPAQAAVRNPGDSKSATTSKHGTSDLPSVNGNRVNQASNVQVKDHGLPGITSKDHDEEIIWDINLTLTDDDNKHAPQRGKRGNVAKQQSKVSKVQKPKKSGMREPAGRASKAKPAEPVTRHLVTTESTYPKSRRAAALNAKKKIRELEEVGDITDEVLSASETQPKFTAANVKMSNSKVVPLASVAQEKALNVREDRTPKVDAFEDSHTTTNKQPKAGPMPDLANNATSNNNAKNSRSPATELQKIHKERPHGVPIIGDLPTQTLQNAREAVTKSPPLAKVPEQTNRVSPNQATKPLNEPTNSITHNMGSFRSMLPSRWQKFTENDSNRQTSNDKSTHQDIIVGPPELPDANGILQGAEDRHFEDALPYTDEASTDTRDGGEDINCEAVATTNRARSKPAVPNARIELASAKTASHVPDPFRARLNNLVPGIKDPGVLAKTSDNPGSIVTREVKHTRLDNDGYNVVREVEQIKKAQSPLLAQEVVAKRKPPTTKSEHAKKRVQDPNVGRELKAETMKSLERIQNRAQSTPRNNVEAVLGVRAEDARERIPPINPPRKSLLISFDDSGPSNQSTISVKRQHIGQNLWIVSPQSKKPQANHTHKRKLADYMDDRQPWEPKQLVKRPKQPLISPDMQTAVSEASKKPNIHIFQERPPRLSSQSTRVAENGSPLPFIQSRKDPSRAWKESMEDEGGVDVPSMNRTDNDGECHQDQDEEPVEGQYHASSKQNASLPNDTKVNFVSSLNNNKHQTSSPQAPSALSAMPPHHINRSGDIVNSKTNEAIVPMNPQDPFIGPSLNPPSSFVERLRKTSDLEAQYQIEKAKERESTANIKRSFMSEEDPDKTLVEHNPTKKRRRVLEEISDSSSNSQQSSTKEGPPSEQTPDEEESNDEGNEQWRKALEPHQDNMLDVLSCISHVGATKVFHVRILIALAAYCKTFG